MLKSVQIEQKVERSEYTVEKNIKYNFAMKSNEWINEQGRRSRRKKNEPQQYMFIFIWQLPICIAT